MLDKLKEAELYYSGVCHKLSTPEALTDPSELRRLMQEEKKLSPIIEKYREYKSVTARLEEALVLQGEGDPELQELADEEIKLCRPLIEELKKELTVLLLPQDPNDEKNVVVEIRAGAGGEEAALFAYDLYRMYSMYASQIGFKLETAYVNETELGGYKEISFTVEGNGAYSRLKYESGVHRVQRVPDTESQGRIHTSTVTVAVLPEAEEVELEINPADIVVETMKSSGAGGQHINKTESAVRLIHKPSGMVIECREERSQYKNRDKAMKLLRTRLYDQMCREQEGKLADARRTQVGTGDRSEKIRTYNFPQRRVTDHRIGYTVHTLDAFLNGNIGGLIDALAAADTAEKLKNSGEK
ncbi:MAG: peptide chain release factor 1 [Clostridia bacterium]|nr:peptide chain release factor 1 [Clostridia bacterium]